MNLLLLGAVSLPVGYMAYGFGYLFVPPKSVGMEGAGVGRVEGGAEQRGASARRRRLAERARRLAAASQALGGAPSPLSPRSDAMTVQ